MTNTELEFSIRCLKYILMGRDDERIRAYDVNEMKQLRARGFTIHTKVYADGE